MNIRTRLYSLALLLCLVALPQLGCESDSPFDDPETGLDGDVDGDSDSDADSDADADSDTDLDEEDYIRGLLVEIAEAELGNCEGVDDRPYMRNQPGYWCYDFVAWVYEQADEGLPPPISLPQMYIGDMPEGWRPEPGDLVKYQIQHYAMVASLSEDEITVYTIEGNWNSCVMERFTTDAEVEYYGYLSDWFDAL
jgi:hypothetical protein